MHIYNFDPKLQNNSMLRELLKEEETLKNEFENFIKTEPVLSLENNENDNFNGLKDVLDNLVKRSEAALKECQLIESLDRQLKLISDTQRTLTDLKKLNELNNLILNTETVTELVPLAIKWRNFTLNKSVLLTLSDSSEPTKMLLNEKLPERIDKEIEQVLLSWTDDIESRDQQSIQLLSNYLKLDSANPLHCLFASYPLTKLNPLLEYHKQLGIRNNNFSDMLLNRFYDILQSDGNNKTTQVAPFSVGQIEVLISEKMKFATRISCILEATFNFIKLHPQLEQKFIEKCYQICNQIRKCAKEERQYDKANNPANTSINAASLDAQLNEISLIITTLSAMSTLSTVLSDEVKKWLEIYMKLEEIYLLKGIQQAIEIDQIITTSEDEDFPVSSCVDDIFYVLKASKGRLQSIPNTGNAKNALIQNSLREFFLCVLKKHLETSIQNLRPLNLFELAPSSQFKPSRELITTVVLLNNLVATRSNWRSFKVSDADNKDDNSNSDSSVDTASVDAVEMDIQNILSLAVNTGIYAKVLQSSIKNGLKTSGEELFLKIHSLITIIYNLFKSIMAKEALGELIGLALTDFSQIFCKQLYDDQLPISSALTLKYDRLLHELTIYLDQILPTNLSDSTSVLRVKQSISLLLVESKKEGQELVEEWKKENTCTLRAGEILLITNKLKQ